MEISPAYISSLSLVKSISSFISSSFCFFISCFISKSSLSRIVGIFGRLKIIFSSGTISSFGFSFSITLSSYPIRQSPLIVCVVFVPTFDEVLAVFVPTFDEVLAVDGPFGKKFLANPLSGGVSGAGST